MYSCISYLIPHSQHIYLNHGHYPGLMKLYQNYQNSQQHLNFVLVHLIQLKLIDHFLQDLRFDLSQLKIRFLSYQQESAPFLNILHILLWMQRLKLGL